MIEAASFCITPEDLKIIWHCVLTVTLTSWICYTLKTL